MGLSERCEYNELLQARNASYLHDCLSFVWTETLGLPSGKHSFSWRRLCLSIFYCIKAPQRIATATLSQGPLSDTSFHGRAVVCHPSNSYRGSSMGSRFAGSVFYFLLFSLFLFLYQVSKQ